MDFGLFDIDNWKSLKDHYLKIVSQTEAYPVQLPDFSSEEECKGFICQQTVLHGYKCNFEKTGDPIYAIDAYTFAYQKGFNIPCWVAKWLYVGLSAYDNAAGMVELSELLGFKSKQKTGSCFQVRAKKERNFDICMDVHLLYLATELSIDKCSEVANCIHRRMGVSDLPAPSSIATLYSRNKEAFKLNKLFDGQFKTDHDKLMFILDQLNAFEDAVSDPNYVFCEKDLQDAIARLSPR